MCSIGVFLDEICVERAVSEEKDISAFSSDDRYRLKLRVACDSINTICKYHEVKFLRHYSLSEKTCCDPFVVHSKPLRRNLREVSVDFQRKFIEVFHLIPGQKLCNVCRGLFPRKLQALVQPEMPTPCVRDEGYALPDEGAAFAINERLAAIGASALNLKKMARTKYVQIKYGQVKKGVRHQLNLALPMDADPLPDSSESSNSCNTPPVDSEMLSQLKERFKSCKRSEQVLILSVLPKSWSIRRIMDEFGASNYLVRKMKRVVEKRGILPSTDMKAGKTLSRECVGKVKDFYEDDEISRVMPGKKDFVSVREDGVRVHRQKRLVLSNLREAYKTFKETYPTADMKIGFSKFAELRPRHCVLAGAAGTHSVCVCTIHQNAKLMMMGARMPTMVDLAVKTTREAVALTMCDPPTVSCHFGECAACPGEVTLKAKLEQALDDSSVDTITYKQWLSTDRTSLETMQCPTDEFVEVFCKKIMQLRTHDFIAAQQAEFMKMKKAGLAPGEVVVIGDFAENYSFVLQDAAQGFHWNNSQASLHPFVCYYRPDADSELKHLSYVAISDSLTHDTVAVHLFQTRLMHHLKATIGNVSKIFYFSDGAASQYKNRKNFINLCHHHGDFGVEAEWHFFATSHGKGPCDGVGGSVKRLAARASLQRPYDGQIMTPHDLFAWAQENLPVISFVFVPQEEIDAHETKLASRFLSLRTIPGTRSFHSFRPLSLTTVSVKTFSLSESETTAKLK